MINFIPILCADYYKKCVIILAISEKFIRGKLSMKTNNDEREKAFEVLYKEMFIKLNIYATNHLNSKSLAEEAVQETFRIAWAKIDKLMSSSNPNGWLMNTLKFVIGNTKRNIMRINKILINDFELDEHTMGSITDEIDPIILYKEGFSEEEIKLLQKYAVEGKSLLEISKEIGVSLAACKKRVQRVKEKFKKDCSHF